jgi:hypothetical protein
MVQRVLGVRRAILGPINPAWKGETMKTLTLRIHGTVPHLKEVVLPEDITAMVATYLGYWGAANMTVVAVPVFPLQALPQEAPVRPATQEDASQKLSAVLASLVKELAELAAQGAKEHSEAVAAHMLTSLDCWYQARVAFAHGHYDRAMELAEATQMIIDDTPDLKQSYPAPAVLDHIWGSDEEEID